MPPQKPQSKDPDFIPADPDFIPAGQNSTPSSVEEPKGNAVQRMFDKLTTITPEQEAGHSPLVNRMQEFGAGAIQGAGQPFVHPFDTLTGAVNTVMHPEDTAVQMAQSIKEHPAQALGNLVGGSVLGLGTADLGETALSKLPSRMRAVNTLKDIESQAADIPVTMANTKPALEGFQEHVQTGGKNAQVMKKLSGRIEPQTPKMSPLERMEAELNGQQINPVAEPINFPEARKFYTNVSDVTRKPGALRRAFEPSRDVRQRVAAGPVREALNSDLMQSLEPLGRSEDYANALKEYAQGERMRSAMRKAGVAAIPAAAGALGVKRLTDLASTVLR